MAEILLLRGDVDEAVHWLEQALTAHPAHDDDYFSAETHRVMAVCLGRAGEGGTTAVAHLRQAMTVARAQGAAFLELRAARAFTAQTGDVTPTLDALARMPEPDGWPDVMEARRLAAT